MWQWLVQRSFTTCVDTGYWVLIPSTTYALPEMECDLLTICLTCVSILLFFVLASKRRPVNFPPGPPRWRKIKPQYFFKKLPLGPPSLPVIGSYPFLSGPGIERLFGTQVRLRTNAIGSIAVSHTGLLLWPNHRHVHGLLPPRRRERLAACKNPLCKRGVLGQNQVGFIWSIYLRNESILCSNYTTNWARSLTGESLGIAMTDGMPLKHSNQN